MSPSWLNNEEDCDCPDGGLNAHHKKVLENPKIRKNKCVYCPKFKENLLVGPTCGTLAIPEYEDGKMVACGCILNIKWKIKSAHCPQGKW